MNGELKPRVFQKVSALSSATLALLLLTAGGSALPTPAFADCPADFSVSKKVDVLRPQDFLNSFTCIHASPPQCKHGSLDNRTGLCAAKKVLRCPAGYLADRSAASKTECIKILAQDEPFCDSGEEYYPNPGGRDKCMKVDRSVFPNKKTDAGFPKCKEGYVLQDKKMSAKPQDLGNVAKLVGRDVCLKVDRKEAE
jgi:hypothetical protein